MNKAGASRRRWKTVCNPPHDTVYNSSMRHNLFISLVLTTALAGAAHGETVSVELEPTKPQVPIAGEVQKRDVPRALFYEKERPVITTETLMTSGYLTPYDHPFATVIDFQQPDKRAASPGDNIYINKGSKAGVKEGDQFYIYHRSDPVIDPDTGNEAGYVVTMAGLISVKEVKEDVALARVDRGFDMIFTGDGLIPRFEVQPPKMDPDRPLEDKTIEGKILYVRYGKDGITQDDTVYLNVGRKQGVRESDLFQVAEYDDKRDDETHGILKDIGRLLVIMVKDESATAVIIKSKSAMKIGDRVSYVQER